MADCIFLHNDVGIRKQDIAYEGIVVSTLFIIIIFPTFDRNCVDQFALFSLILSTMEVNRSLFLLPNFSGSPRFPLACSFLHRPDNTSLQRINRYGERGSPCLIPR